MAARNSGKQGVGVYFVCPRSSAAFAASLMNAGVSKSGSPAPKPTTSTPAFFSAAAFALTFSVIASLTALIRRASGKVAMVQPLLAEWWGKLNRTDRRYRRSLGHATARRDGPGSVALVDDRGGARAIGNVRRRRRHAPIGA